MPIYEYTCHSCQQPFEKLVRFGDSGQAPECPHCHSRETKKKLSLFAAATPSGSSAPSTGGSSCGGAGRFT